MHYAKHCGAAGNNRVAFVKTSGISNFDNLPYLTLVKLQLDCKLSKFGVDCIVKVAIDERNMWIVRLLHSSTRLGSETESRLDSNFELFEYSNSSNKRGPGLRDHVESA